MRTLGIHGFPWQKMSIINLTGLFLVISTLNFSISSYAHPTHDDSVILNGDFSQGLEHWKVVLVETIGEYPTVDVAGDNPYLRFDTPLGTAAYVEQSFYLPQSEKAILFFKTWGFTDPANATIRIVNSTGTYFVDVFEPQGKMTFDGIQSIRTVDLTEYSGQNLSIKIFVTASSGTGAGAGFDDIQIQAAYEENSVITIEANPIYPITIGANITVSGQFFPSDISPPLTLTYTRPNGSTIETVVLLDKNNSYLDQFCPDKVGMWRVRASWDGNSNYSATESPICMFSVGIHGGVYLSSANVCGKELDLDYPEIEVLPEAQINGTISFLSASSRRTEVNCVVGLSSWEQDSIDFLLVFNGIVCDWVRQSNFPFGYRTKCLFSDLGICRGNLYFDPNNGSYIQDHYWSFPVGPGFYNSSFPHPELRAPNIEGDYYIVIRYEAVTDISMALYDIHLLGQEFESIWDLRSIDWERFVPGNRNPMTTSFQCLAIKVKVVNPELYIDKANQTLIFATQNGMAKWNNSIVTKAEELISEAMTQLVGGNLSDAKELALEANGTILEGWPRYSESIIQGANDEIANTHCVIGQYANILNGSTVYELEGRLIEAENDNAAATRLHSDGEYRDSTELAYRSWFIASNASCRIYSIIAKTAIDNCESIVKNAMEFVLPPEAQASLNQSKILYQQYTDQIRFSELPSLGEASDVLVLLNISNEKLYLEPQLSVYALATKANEDILTWLSSVENEACTLHDQAPWYIVVPLALQVIVTLVMAYESKKGQRLKGSLMGLSSNVILSTVLMELTAVTEWFKNAKDFSFNSGISITVLNLSMIFADVVALAFLGGLLVSFYLIHILVKDEHPKLGLSAHQKLATFILYCGIAVSVVTLVGFIVALLNAYLVHNTLGGILERLRILLCG